MTILLNSLNLIYEKNADVIKTLENYFNEGGQEENCVLLMNYLIMKDSRKKLFNEGEMNTLFKILNKVAEMIYQDISVKIKDKFRKEDTKGIDKNMLKTCKLFFKISIEEAIALYCSDEGK